MLYFSTFPSGIPLPLVLSSCNGGGEVTSLQSSKKQNKKFRNLDHVPISDTALNIIIDACNLLKGRDGLGFVLDFPQDAHQAVLCSETQYIFVEWNSKT